MRIVLLGGSGFLGRHLATYLRSRGDVVLVGGLRAGTAAAAAKLCAGCDAAINLAGANVARRWTAAHKAEFRSSRVDRTRELVAELGRLPEAERPKAYVCCSAIGYYETSETATYTEEDEPGTGLLPEICVALEHEAERVRSLGMRLTILRIGIVLGADGGALKAFLPLYRMGLGGRIGSGRQWMSWIHIADQIGLFASALDGAEGVINGTAPHPVTNAEFSRALGRAVRRPAVLPAPAFAMRLIFGDGAVIVTEGHRVLPVRAEQLGYQFQYPTIEAAMASAVRRSAGS